MDRLHQIKRGAEQGLVVTKDENLRSRRVVRMKLGQHAKFAAHVVGSPDFAAEWRTAKNHFPRTELHEIRQVRVAARVLTYDERSRFFGEMRAKERFQFGEVEFLSRPDRRRLILKTIHLCPLPLPLPISQQCGVVQMLK